MRTIQSSPVWSWRVEIPAAGSFIIHNTTALGAYRQCGAVDLGDIVPATEEEIRTLPPLWTWKGNYDAEINKAVAANTAAQ